MKKILSLLMLIAFLVANAKDVKEVVFTTNPPLSCSNCENTIKKNLRFEKGVMNIETNIPDQRVTVKYDADKTDVAKLEQGFAKINYKVTIVGEDNEVDGHTEATSSKGNDGKKETNSSDDVRHNPCCVPGAECCQPGAECCEPIVEKPVQNPEATQPCCE